MKITSIIFLLIVVLSILTATDAFAEIIGVLKTVFSVGQFIYSMIQKIREKPEKIDTSLKKQQLIYTNLLADNTDVLEALSEIPEKTNLIDQEQDLYKKFGEIELAFIEAMNKYEYIYSKHRVEDRSQYKSFANGYEKSIKQAMWEIRSKLTNEESPSRLTRNFKESLVMIENVCTTNVSNNQVLFDLYEKYVVAMSKYFVTESLIFDFLEVFVLKNDSKDLSVSRDMFYDQESETHKQTITNLKEALARASLDFYKCYNPKGSSKKIHTFQKYYKRHVRMKKNDPPCAEITKTDENECDHDSGNDDEPCVNKRTCSKLFCREMFTTEESQSNESPNSTVVCVIDDPKDSKARYYSATEYTTEAANKECPENSKKYTLTWFGDYGSYMSPCDCICQDENFFVSQAEVLADTSNNNVVTGARLALKENTLHIQIQQGRLLESGKIDASSVRWTPNEEDLKNNPESDIAINWDGFKEFALTEIKLPIHRIVTGLKFTDSLKDMNDNTRRIGLMVISSRFNFTSGELNVTHPVKHHHPHPGREELILSNCDVPTKSKDRKMKFSEPDQFVALTITDLEKDAGQTTIPFIDTQDVVTNPLTPLTGLGLYHKGQTGFGGFIGLKLLTYNVTSQIDEDFNLDKEIMNDGVKKLRDFVGGDNLESKTGDDEDEFIKPSEEKIPEVPDDPDAESDRIPGQQLARILDEYEG